MDTHGFETEARLRREIAGLQEKVANLLDIQIRAEAYRLKVLEEYSQLERKNKELKAEIRELLTWSPTDAWQPQPVPQPVTKVSE